MSIVDSLRKLSLKLTGSVSAGEAIEDNIAYMAEKMDAFSPFKPTVVETLPEEGVENVLYLVPKEGDEDDTHDEYIWVDGHWEKVGSMSSKNSILVAGDNGGVTTIFNKGTAEGECSFSEGFVATSTAMGAHAEGGNILKSFLRLTGAKSTTTYTVRNTYNVPLKSGDYIVAQQDDSTELTATVTSVTKDATGAITSITLSRTINPNGDLNGNLVDVYTCTLASGESSHAEGLQTEASGRGAHSEGYSTLASGMYAHAEGHNTKASGGYAHAEGDGTISGGPNTHAEGYQTRALYAAQGGHAEGTLTVAYKGGHAEGYATSAVGEYSHAEGGPLTNREPTKGTMVLSGSGPTYTVESYQSVLDTFDLVGCPVYLPLNISAAPVNIKSVTKNNDVITTITLAEKLESDSLASVTCTVRKGTRAIGDVSHAEGYETTAKGFCSHAEGRCTTANGTDQHVSGRYNIEDNSNAYAEIIGNGTKTAPSNARTLDWSGNAWYAGNVTAAGGSLIVGSTTITEAQLQALLAMLPTS